MKREDLIEYKADENFGNGLVYSIPEVNQVLDEKDAEIESLKAKLDSVQASAYADSVDAGMRERRLRLALWLARGYIMTLLKRDFQRLAYQCNNDDYKNNLLRRRNRYYDLYEKCLKKAEEYR